MVDLLVRSWIESIFIAVSFCQVWVDLLVRSWIESFQFRRNILFIECRPPREVVNWKATLLSNSAWFSVDLLVRSWIERPCFLQSSYLVQRRPPREVVNWKSSTACPHRSCECRPPREVVNWKMMNRISILSEQVDLLVRSWIERQCKKGGKRTMTRRPPREVVNWKFQMLWL